MRQRNGGLKILDAEATLIDGDQSSHRPRHRPWAQDEDRRKKQSSVRGTSATKRQPKNTGCVPAVRKVKKKHRFRNLQRKQGPLKRTAVGEKTLENKFPYVLKDHNLSEHGR